MSCPPGAAGTAAAAHAGSTAGRRRSNATELPPCSLEVPAALAVPVARLGLHVGLPAGPARSTIRARGPAVGAAVRAGGRAIGPRRRGAIVASARRSAVGGRRPAAVAPIALSIRITPRRRLPGRAVALWRVGPRSPARVPARPARRRRAARWRPRHWLRCVRARRPTLLALGPVRKVGDPTRRARPVPACTTTARRTTTGPAGGHAQTRSVTHAREHAHRARAVVQVGAQPPAVPLIGQHRPAQARLF